MSHEVGETASISVELPESCKGCADRGGDCHDCAIYQIAEEIAMQKEVVAWLNMKVI